MNKRITSIVLSLVMLFTMLATAVPVLAATPVELKVTADTTSANPGDTINYKVSIGAVTDMGGLEFKLDIPSGLTIDDSSISIPDGLETIIDSDGPIIVPTRSNKYYWLYSAQLTGYTGTSDLVILTFSCKVDDGTTGTKTVSIKEVVLIDQSVDDMPFNVTGADVNVTAAPVSVTGVTIDETLSVNIGQTKTPSFTVAPAEATNKTVSFTSDNPAVATVNATTGEVTGVSKGTATITVKTADGNFTDTCTVTVSCAHTNKSTVPAKDSTCTEKGWDEYKKCDDCGQLFDKNGNEISTIPYLSLADHTPAQTATAEYLKSAATCTSAAVYYEHCSVCNVKLSTTFTSGSTVPHTESGWKSDEEGHWKECTVCGTITTAKVAHTPDHEGQATEEYAIKCTACDYVIEAQLSHTHVFDKEVATDAYKATDATCTAKATYYKSCACGAKGTATFEYGELAAHNPASVWTSDASGHWHACQTAGCTEKCDFATHTPDHTGHATEEYAIKCTACDYVIEAQLSHTHVFDKEVATDAYKATDATCTAKATYYHSCVCGAKGTTTFEYGELADHNWTPATCTAPKTCSVCHATEGDPLGHTEGTEWKSDKDNHWHTCTVAGCGVVIESSKAAHAPDREAATETDPIKCSVCDYIITPALGMQDYIVEMPVSLIVKLTGDKKPAKETFKFEIYDLGYEDAAFEIVNDSVVVENLEFNENGVAFAGGIIKIKVTGEDQLCNLTEGFSVRMVKGSTKGWTYASEQWRIEPFFENDALDLVITVKEIVDGEISEEYANGMSFAVSYEAVSEPDPTEPDPIKPDPIKPDPIKPDPTEPDPTEPTESDPNTGAPDDVPQTGDNSNMILWIALLLASGLGVTGTVVYSKRKKYAE